MKKKSKYILLWGISIAAIVSIIELLLFGVCKEGLVCVDILSILLIPGLLVEGILSGAYSLLIFDFIFYFILGSLIGWVVWKVKKK